MRLIPILMLALAFATPSAVNAGGPVVVELFTSQGCSSCPPADVNLGKLKERDDVIALSLHVDYWDYLGWKDQFASPQNTQRQRSYARARGSRRVYTPQVVVQGLGQGVGSRRGEVNKLIAKGLEQASDLVLSARRIDGKIEIALSSTAGGTVPCIVQLVEYSPQEQVAIKRGELAGKTLNYHNVVRHWNQVAKWDGRGEMTFRVEAKSDLPAVVIVQADHSGPILAAMKLN